MSRLTCARALLSSGAALIAIAAAPAFAQDQTTPPDISAGSPDQTQAADTSGAGDIVVTARRREERLLNTPIAITAFTGQQLEKHMVVPAGAFLYIPADMPHLPYNASDTEPCVAIIARTDPNEQESVVLLPELEPLVAEREAARKAKAAAG